MVTIILIMKAIMNFKKLMALTRADGLSANNQKKPCQIKIKRPTINFNLV